MLIRSLRALSSRASLAGSLSLRTNSSLGRHYSSTTRTPSSLVSWSVDENDKVGTITLQSPKTFNALTVEMGTAFERAIDQISKELFTSSNVQAIVLQGEGEQAFSAGGNLEWLLSLNQNSVHTNTDAMLQFYNSFLCMRQKIPVPVIAALQGPAMGAGACLALACDLRVAASGNVRVLGFPFSKLGIPSGMGGLYLLQQQGLPAAKATEILLLGHTLTGEEAYELGLINRLVEANQVKAKAHDLARAIAKRHPVAVRSLIRSWRLGKDSGLSEALYRDAHAQAMCYNREDWGRGLNAVAEKRDADFDGYHEK
jgi:enoyl-CoA hydratase/carnithine racemase